MVWKTYFADDEENWTQHFMGCANATCRRQFRAKEPDLTAAAAAAAPVVEGDTAEEASADCGWLLRELFWQHSRLHCNGNDASKDIRDNSP